MNQSYQQFVEWLESQPVWLQDAAWRLYNSYPIDDKIIDEYADMCVDESRKLKPVFHKLDATKIYPCVGKTRFALSQVRSIIGVNALSKEATLNFEPDGITVIYGLNGAGKSGFMRIFKKACGTPYAEPIYPNVFTSDVKTSSCCIACIKDGVTSCMDLNLNENSADSAMQLCDVFDSKISGGYIEKQNSVCYEPFVFTVLAELAKTAEKVKNILVLRKQRMPTINATPPDVFRSLGQAQWLYAISATSKIPEECKTWGESDTAALEKTSASLDLSALEAKRKYAISALANVDYVFRDINDRVLLLLNDSSIFDSELNALLQAKERAEAATKLFSEQADEIDRLSLTNEAWQQMWKYAKSYYSDLEKTTPVTGETASNEMCPLCHQMLTDEKLLRFQSIDTYINGKVSDAYEQARKRLKSHLSPLLDIPTEEALRRTLSEYVPNDVLVAVIERYRMISNVTSACTEIDMLSRFRSIDFSSILKEVNIVRNLYSAHIAEYDKALQIDQKEKIVSELRVFQYRKWVYDNLTSINAAIESFNEEAKLEKACQLVTTNKITTESNAMAQALISDAYIERFVHELSFLAPQLKVQIEKIPSQKGKSPYKIVLRSEVIELRRKPESILSEGEQRIVALAAFFADATGRDELSPIIIDDPISSLDYNFEEKATRRIVTLAKSRQVIVFTHRISLLVAMKDCSDSEKINCSEVHIRSTAKGNGLGGLESLYTGSVSQQLDGLIKNARSAQLIDVDTEEHEAIKGRIFQQFRICVERSIEDILISKVVQRFNRNIRSKGMLPKLLAIERNDCEMLDLMMTKYSFMEHSQPQDACDINISLPDVITDIECLQAWITDFNKRVKQFSA